MLGPILYQELPQLALRDSSLAPLGFGWGVSVWVTLTAMRALLLPLKAASHQAEQPVLSHLDCVTASDTSHLEPTASRLLKTFRDSPQPKKPYPGCAEGHREGMMSGVPHIALGWLEDGELLFTEIFQASTLCSL